MKTTQRVKGEVRDFVFVTYVYNCIFEIEKFSIINNDYISSNQNRKVLKYTGYTVVNLCIQLVFICRKKTSYHDGQIKR